MRGNQDSIRHMMSVAEEDPKPVPPTFEIRSRHTTRSDGVRTSPSENLLVHSGSD